METNKTSLAEQITVARDLLGAAQVALETNDAKAARALLYRGTLAATTALEAAFNGSDDELPLPPGQARSAVARLNAALPGLIEPRRELIEELDRPLVTISVALLSGRRCWGQVTVVDLPPGVLDGPVPRSPLPHRGTDEGG